MPDPYNNDNCTMCRWVGRIYDHDCFTCRMRPKCPEPKSFTVKMDEADMERIIERVVEKVMRGQKP